LGDTLKAFFFFFIILALPVVAVETYPFVGGDNSDFLRGVGFFNDDLESYQISARLNSRVTGAPLVDDLNGDGDLEIVVMNGALLSLYQSKSLTLLASANTLASTNPFYGVFDLDNDGRKEVIVTSQGSRQIEIFDYNTTHFKRQVNFSSGIVGNNGYKWFGCRDTPFKICMVFGTNYRTINAGVQSGFYATTFNHLVIGNFTTVHVPLFDTTYCEPGIPMVAVKDYDQDGTEEFIVSYSMGKASSADVLYIKYYDTSLFGVPSLERSISMNYAYDMIGPSQNCDVGSKVFTAPLVDDFQGTLTNGMETVIGMQTSASTFKAYSFKADGSLIDDYPELVTGSGIIVSNPIRAAVMPDSVPQGSDFCVMGYNAGDVDLLCASEYRTDYLQPKTEEFDYVLTEDWNVSTTYGNWERLIHAANYKSELIEGQDLSEIITAYGVFSLDYIDLNELLLIWPMPQTKSVVVPVDAEKVGREDLLSLTSANLFYIDDKYSNSEPELSAYSVNPCITATWKLNTTAEVVVKIEDVDSNNVRARAFLYYGTPYQIGINWTDYGPSGTSFPFTFEANHTIGSGTIFIEFNDDYNPLGVNSVSLTFSVGSMGVEYGDCITEFDAGANESLEPGAEASDEEKAQAEALFSGGGTIPKIVGGLLFLIMLTVAVAFLAAREGVPGNVNAVITSIVFFVGWIVLTIFSVLPAWPIVVGVIFAAAVVGWKFYHQSQGGGGLYTP
jgi:hypothetical protein